MQIELTTFAAISSVFPSRSDVFAFFAELGKTDVCGRCGGSGQHSFHLMHGTTCFGCNGSGKSPAKLTKVEITALAKLGPEGYRARLAKLAASRQVREAAAAIQATKDHEVRELKAAAAAIEAAKVAAAIEAEKEAKKAAALARSTHIGKVGERLTITATVKKIITGEGQFGAWFLTIMELEDGSSILWRNAFTSKGDWGSDDRIESPKTGDAVTFKATVKTHGVDRYTGAKQTEVQRAALMSCAKGRAMI